MITKDEGDRRARHMTRGTNEDAKRIHHPHDDVIVITLLIMDYTTRRVLVDNGSLADILYYPTFQQMKLG